MSPKCPQPAPISLPFLCEYFTFFHCLDWGSNISQPFPPQREHIHSRFPQECSSASDKHPFLSDPSVTLCVCKGSGNSHSMREMKCATAGGRL